MIPSAGEKKYSSSENIGRHGSRKKCSSEIHFSGWFLTRATSVSTHSFKLFAIRDSASRASRLREFARAAIATPRVVRRLCTPDGDAVIVTHHTTRTGR